MDPLDDDKPKTYTPFTGLMMVILTLGLWFAGQIFAIYGQDKELRANIAQISPEAEKEQRAREHLAALVEDLRQTAATDPKAAQVLDEFDIPANPNH